MHYQFVKKKIKVGLIEIKNPFHGFAGLIDFFSHPKIDLIVFSTKEIINHIKTDIKSKDAKYNICLKKNNETKNQFLTRIKYTAKDLDLIIVNSIQITSFVSFNPNCKKLFFVYNTNWWLKQTLSIKYYLNGLLKVKYIVNRNLIRNTIIGPIIRRKILSYYDGIIVEYNTIKQHVIDDLGYRKKVFVLPNFPYYGSETNNKIKKNKLIHFIIPGKIEFKRRDYNEIYVAFEQICKQLDLKFELTLLGEPIGEYGLKINSKFETLKQYGCKINVFDSFVIPSIYKFFMAKSDIILAPLKLRFQFDAISEYYTKSKGSGIISDSIFYGKPLILPSRCLIDSEMSGAVSFYDNTKSLIDLIANLITNDENINNIFFRCQKNYETNYKLSICQEKIKKIFHSLDLEIDD